jgi:hypothetical protein
LGGARSSATQDLGFGYGHRLRQTNKQNRSNRMNKATAVITCEGSERVITVSYSEKETDSENATIDFVFNPPLDKDEKALECERGLETLFKMFMRGIKS